MAKSAYKRNHVVSACYLDGWTDDTGTLVAVRKHTKQANRSRPRAVGFRNNFWAKSAATRQIAEMRLASVEGRAAPVLRELPTEWPYPKQSEGWFALLQFIAMHVVRTPAWRRQTSAMHEANIAERLDEHRAMFGDRVDDLLAHLRSGEYMTDLMLGQIPKLASLLGSMHCTLLRFDEPLLVTSDQPVTPVALPSAAGPAPIEAVPATGLMGTVEFRFPIDPRHALLLTWLDEPDDGPMLASDYATACNLNVATAKQGDSEFFHHPARKPPFFVPPMAQLFSAPLGEELYPHYTPPAVRNSERKRRTQEIMDRLIEDEIVNRIETVVVTRPANS